MAGRTSPHAPQTSEELQRYVLPEGLSEVRRVGHLLRHGDAMQRHSALCRLDDALLDDGTAGALQELLPLVQARRGRAPRATARTVAEPFDPRSATRLARRLTDRGRPRPSGPTLRSRCC